MDAKNRLTAQGIRDLNYYGPRRVPTAAAAPEVPTGEPEVDTQPAPVSAPEVAAPIAVAE